MELDLQRFYNINRRILMWIVFFAILFLLRDFFALMFLTFIFAFAMRNVSRFLTRTMRVPYWASVVVPYLVVVALLVLLIVKAIPKVADDGAKFAHQFPELLRTVAVEVKKTAHRYGLREALAKAVDPETFVARQAARLSATQPAGDAVAAGADMTTGRPDLNAAGSGGAALATQPVAGFEDRYDVEPEQIAEKMKEMLFGILPGLFGDTHEEPEKLVANGIRAVFGGTLQFLLAILLSFLILLDFDRVTAELRHWRSSRVGAFFHEASGSVIRFSEVVGQAFQCQLVVSLLNTILTGVGLFVLDIQPLLLLITIVFLFGLIPVLGVFISSVPIILIAFNDHGLVHALIALALIVVVHMMEAYVFNPRIYAARFHLNPVIVLIILLVAHELFGVWGMLLGIPVTYYVLNIAQMPSIQKKPKTAKKGKLAMSPPRAAAAE